MLKMQAAQTASPAPLSEDSERKSVHKEEQSFQQAESLQSHQDQHHLYNIKLRSCIFLL